MAYNNNPKTHYRYPFFYDGSIILLFISLLFPPLTAALLFINGRIIRDDTAYFLAYKGSTGWLIFWIIIFFPVALVLLVINGVDLIKETGRKL